MRSILPPASSASSAKLYVLQCWRRCARPGIVRFSTAHKTRGARVVLSRDTPALQQGHASTACPQRPALRSIPTVQHVGYVRGLMWRSSIGGNLSVTRRGMIFGGRNSGSKPDNEEFYPAEALREAPAEGPVAKRRKSARVLQRGHTCVLMPKIPGGVRSARVGCAGDDEKASEAAVSAARFRLRQASPLLRRARTDCGNHRSCRGKSSKILRSRVESLSLQLILSNVGRWPWKTTTSHTWCKISNERRCCDTVARKSFAANSCAEKSSDVAAAAAAASRTCRGTLRSAGCRRASSTSPSASARCARPS